MLFISHSSFSSAVNCGDPLAEDDEVLQVVDPDPSTLFGDKVQFKCESKYYTLEGEGEQADRPAYLVHLLWLCNANGMERMKVLPPLTSGNTVFK